jgi:ATP-dependent RNA helicase DDX56/DBP9
MASWESLGLDPRLQRAAMKRFASADGCHAPTLVQQECIPRVLEGKDIVARARTGSGKTLAYILPMMHRILSSFPSGSPSFNGIVLTPTRELCEQVQNEASLVSQHCGGEIIVSSLIGDNVQQLKRSCVSAGHLVVSTPGKLATAIKEGWVSSASIQARLTMLVLDEADLLLSYGYEEDLQLISQLVPRSCQCMLMSATVSEDVEKLTKLILHSPISLNLLQPSSQATADGKDPNTNQIGSSDTIEHFSYDCATGDDRLLVAMSLLKLGLVKKKCLVFVNTVDRGYQLKLFLESFGVKSAVLNAELPVNSRSHILQSFNKGLFDYLIATDDIHAQGHDALPPSSNKRKRDQKLLGKDGRRGTGEAAKKKKDEEFGVTRGIDFQGVRTVINYDLPSSVQGYVHRVGRTGRAGHTGVAITFFTPNDRKFREELHKALVGKQGVVSASDAQDEEEEQGGGEVGSKSGPLRTFGRLPPNQVEALRYRGEDIAKSITRKVIREARAKELKLELLNSETLKSYFEEHAAEKQLLRHDKPLHKLVQAPHLKHVPAYLKDTSIISKDRSFVKVGPMHDVGASKKRRKVDGRAAKEALENGDPLKSVSAVGFIKVPKRGGNVEEDLTEMEKRATIRAKKDAKIRAKSKGLPPVPKTNVKKFTRRR